MITIYKELTIYYNGSIEYNIDFGVGVIAIGNAKIVANATCVKDCLNKNMTLVETHLLNQ